MTKTATVHLKDILAIVRAQELLTESAAEMLENTRHLLGVIARGETTADAALQGFTEDVERWKALLVPAQQGNQKLRLFLASLGPKVH